MTGLDYAAVRQILLTIAISAGLTVIVGSLAILVPKFGRVALRQVEQSLSCFAERKARAVSLIFVAVIAVRLLALPLLRVPVPGIHDEYCYLLLGDTFAHGRLANPPHPMWISFETFHVNWLPAYASMYPPAQGFALALGEWLGHPWIGVLLSNAAMCAAILWMLQAWMPARWAFLGATLAALKLGIASYWMNSYWGGAVAAIGGALVLGALPRLVRRRPRVRDALLLGLGAAILANSRPYEGLLLCLPAAIWFVWWLAGRTGSRVRPRVRVRNALLPLAVVSMLTAAFMSYYNWRLTGNPLLMPHVLNNRTYRSAGLFIWEQQKPQKHYRNQQFEDFYNRWERENYDNTWPGIWRVTKEKLIRCGLTYFWVGVLLALPVLPALLRDRKMRLLWITFILGAVGVFVVIWSNPHYAAPLTAVIFALIVQALRHLRIMRIRGRPLGLALSRAIVLLLVLDTGINTIRGICDPQRWPCEGDPSRQDIADKLAHIPGKHLILVRYQQPHNIHDEWVYNGAEIDSAKVLWARELDAQQNAKLFAYFRDRRVWLATPDTDNQYLEPYTPPGAPLLSDQQSEP